MTGIDNQSIDALREAVETQLPSSVVGVFLYGSLAKGTEHADSDVDLLFAVEDEPCANLLNEISEVCSCFFGTRKKSINVESLTRLRAFVEVGDPFVWNVLVTGIRVVSRSSINSLLRTVEATTEFDADAVAKYLAHKATVSAQILISAIASCRVQLHLASVSLVQAEILKMRRRVSVSDLLLVSDYSRLLQETHDASLRGPLLAAFAAHSNTTTADDPLRLITNLGELLTSKASQLGGG